MRSPQDRRKALHAATGLLAMLLRDATPGFAVALAGILVVHNVVFLPRWAPSLLRSPGRALDAGIVTYPIVVLGLVLAFHARLELAAAAWGVLAFGDGLADPVGRRARRTLPWNPGKTWAGSLAFLIAGTAAGTALLLWVAPETGAGRAILLVLPACLLAAVLESLPVRLDDNPRVGLGAGAGLALTAAVDPALAAQAWPVWADRLPWVAGGSALLAAVSARAGTVTVSGVVVGVVLATVLGTFGGAGVYAAFAAFFVLGSGATHLGRRIKEARGLAQARRGRRGASHALANVGVAGLLTLAAPMTDRTTECLIGAVAALATAAFDTVATEVGQVWGRRTTSLRTRRRVPPGTPGAVSPEGSGAGLLAAALVVLAGIAGGAIPSAALGPATAGATVGAVLESVAGSWPAVRERLDGGTMNLLNTVIGAGAAMLLVRLAGV